MKMKFTRPDLLVDRGSKLTDLKTHEIETITAGPWYDNCEKPSHTQIVDVMTYQDFRKAYPALESRPTNYIDCYAVNRRETIVIVF